MKTLRITDSEGIADTYRLAGMNRSGVGLYHLIGISATDARYANLQFRLSRDDEADGDDPMEEADGEDGTETGNDDGPWWHVGDPTYVVGVSGWIHYPCAAAGCPPVVSVWPSKQYCGASQPIPVANWRVDIADPMGAEAAARSIALNNPPTTCGAGGLFNLNVRGRWKPLLNAPPAGGVWPGSAGTTQAYAGNIPQRTLIIPIWVKPIPIAFPELSASPA